MRKLGAASIALILLGLAYALNPGSNPTFSAAPGSPYAVGSNPSSLVVADLNLDGIPDVAVANSGSNSVTLYYGQSGANLGKLGGVNTMTPISGPPAALNVVAERTLNASLQIGYPQLLGATNGRSVFAAAVNGSNVFGSQYGYHDLSGTIPSGQTSKFVVTGDFNGDGRGDDATLTSDNQIIIEKGGVNSSSFFETFTPSVTAIAIAAGDLNGDGRADLAITASNGNIVIFTADANGSFKTIAPITKTPGVAPTNIAIGDVTGDGIADIITTSTSAGATVTVFPGTGGGAFGALFTLTLGNNAQGIPLIGDFNRDFIPDLVVPTAGNNVNLFLGQGNNAFGSPVAIPTGTTPTSVGAGDFNQDGKLDLVVANGGDNTISLLLNTTPAIKSGPTQLSFLATTGGTNPAVKTVQLAFDDAQSPTVTVTSDQFWLSASTSPGNTVDVLADISGLPGGAYTGRITVTAPGYMQTVIAVSLQVSTPAGTFTKGTTFTTSQGTSMAAGDFNNDGALDIVSAKGSSFSPACNCFEFIPGNNDGTFGTHITTNFSGNFQPIFAATGDFNGDGNLDVMFSDYLGAKVAVMFGDGAGNFRQSPFIYGIGAFPINMVTGDFNRDGKPDVAILCLGPTVPNTGSTSGEIWLFLNDGTGVFTTPKITGVGDHPFGLAMADYNNDGFLDFAVINNYDKNLKVYLGVGNGQFGSPTAVSVPAGFAPIRIAAGDFDGDGKMDLAMTEQPTGAGSAIFHILLGNGAGAFPTLKGPYTTTYTDLAIVLGDFDGDAKLDLSLLLYQSFENLQVGLGDGAGAIVYDATTSHNFTVGGQPTLEVTQIAADFNGDGRLDLLTWDNQGAAIWYGNKAATTIVASSTPATTAASGVNTKFKGTVSVTQPAWAKVASVAGTVTINDVTSGTVQIDSGAPTAGVFTSANQTLSVGAHTIKALLASDPLFTGSTSADYTFTVTGSASSPASLTSSGTPQSATVGTAFANALTVTVKDGSSNVLSGIDVVFTAPASGASGVFSNNGNKITVTTNGSGVASAPFTANTTAGGPYTVTGVVNALSVDFTLTNNPGAAASLTPGGTPQSAAISTAFANPLTVTVKDANNNLISGVNVVFTAPGSGASGLFSNNTTTITVATNASGVASAPFTANATVGGAYTVTGAVNALTANFSLTNNAAAGPPASLTPGGTPQSATVSTAFANPLTVTVKDANNNLLSGINVLFTAPGSGASGVFSNNTTTITVATNASGVASAPFTANATVGGPYSVTAGVNALSTGFSLTNSAAPVPTTIAAGGTPQSATVGTAFGSALTATVKDAGNSPMSGVNVTFTAPAAGPGVVSGLFSNSTNTITVATNGSGVASASFTANSKAGGPYTVTAAVNALTANYSLTNTAGAALNLAISGGDNQSAATNHTFSAPLSLQMTDASANPVPNVAVTLTAPGSGASGTFPGGGVTFNGNTNAQGIVTTNFTANQNLGSYNVTASAAGKSGVFHLTNTALPLPSLHILAGNNQFIVIGNPAGTQFQLNITDGDGNPLNGVQVTFTSPNSGPSGSFPGGLHIAGTITQAVRSRLTAGGMAAANGVSTVTSGGVATSPAFTANTIAGSYQVTASSVYGNATFNVTNVPGPPAQMQILSGGIQSIGLGSIAPVPMIVKVGDSYGNAITGQTVNFSVTPVAGAGGAFTGNTNVVTDALGTATAPTFTANNTVGSYTITAASGGLQAVFSLSNRSVAALQVVSGSGQTTPIGAAFGLPLSARVVDANNAPIAGVAVTFAAPANFFAGATAVFNINAQTSVVAITNAAGIATTPIPAANNWIGAYAVVATASGKTASFALSNGSAPAPEVQPTGLAFNMTVGDPVPPAQILTITGGAGSFTATADTTWLKFTYSTATTLTVSVDPTGLAAGSYFSNLVISGKTTVPVVFIIAAKPVIVINPAALTFTYTQGKANPVDQFFSVTSSVRSYKFTADVRYVNPTSGSWLSIAYSGGTATPATMRAIVNPDGLEPGTYLAAIRVVAPDLSNAALELPVSLLVSKTVTTSQPAITAIVNAASSQAGAVTGGEIVTLYGINVTCGGSPIVLVDGSTAQMLSAKSDQINFVVPDEVAGKSRTAVQVNCGAANTGPFTVPVAPAVPGIFTGSGGGASAYNQDGTVNSAASAAPRGSVVTLYGTGFGALTAPDAGGLRRLVSPVSVTIGGLPAQVFFAGAAPGLPGVVQLNVQVPGGTQPGAASLQVAVGVTQTQSGVTLSVN